MRQNAASVLLVLRVHSRFFIIISLYCTSIKKLILPFWLFNVAATRENSNEITMYSIVPFAYSDNVPAHDVSMLLVYIITGR